MKNSVPMSFQLIFTLICFALSPKLALSRGFGGGFGDGHMAEFGDRAGGGAFGGGGFAGGEAMRYGGDGIGAGHFGGGGLGSVRGSGSESGVSQDWASRAQNSGEDHTQFQQNRFQQEDQLQSQRFQEANHLQNRNEVDRAYNYNHSYDYAGYYGYGFMPFYYGGTWGGFYSGMMMGQMNGMMLGSTIATLPNPYTTTVVNGTPYYYSNGAYLTQAEAGNGYTLVPPPPGATVKYLPSNCSPVYFEHRIFQDCGGAFYEPIDDEYKVVRPPPGVMVGDIPQGSVAKKINGTQYFEYGGVWYQPYYAGSDVMYRIISNPNDCPVCGF